MSFCNKEIKEHILNCVNIKCDLCNNDKIVLEKKESVARMVVHGCLHLLGYTHKKKNDRMEMERRERWVLERIEKKNLLSK